jgi:hypothetical protein
MLVQAVIGAPRATCVGHLLFKNAAESVGEERRTLSSQYMSGVPLQPQNTYVVPGAQWQTKGLQLQVKQ